MSSEVGPGSPNALTAEHVLRELARIRAAVEGPLPPGIEDLKAMREVLSSPYFMAYVEEARLLNMKADLIKAATDLDYSCGDRKAQAADAWERAKDFGRNGGIVLIGVGLAAMFAATAPVIAILAAAPLLAGGRIAFGASQLMAQLAAEKKLYEDLERLARNISETLSGKRP